MRKCFLTLLMITMLFGCTQNGAAKIEIEKREYETDTAVVNIQLPVFSGLHDSQFQEQLNAELDNEINACLERFTSESEQGTITGTEKNVFQVTQDIAYNKNNFVSIVSECYIFTGGAHGATDRMPRNIDIQQGKILKLADLFLDEGYKQKLVGEINRIMEESPEAYSDLWEKPVLGAAQEDYFYIQDGDLVIFYPPYELSYYARGFVEFRIPVKGLSGYIKPEYMSLA